MVIMHETLKLLHYAEAQDVRFFRIGTSGGLGMTLFNIIILLHIHLFWKMFLCVKEF